MFRKDNCEEWCDKENCSSFLLVFKRYPFHAISTVSSAYLLLTLNTCIFGCYLGKPTMPSEISPEVLHDSAKVILPGGKCLFRKNRRRIVTHKMQRLRASISEHYKSGHVKRFGLTLGLIISDRVMWDAAPLLLLRPERIFYFKLNICTYHEEVSTTACAPKLPEYLSHPNRSILEDPFYCFLGYFGPE